MTTRLSVWGRKTYALALYIIKQPTLHHYIITGESNVWMLVSTFPRYQSHFVNVVNFTLRYLPILGQFHKRWPLSLNYTINNHSWTNPSITSVVIQEQKFLRRAIKTKKLKFSWLFLDPSPPLLAFRPFA